MRLPGTAARAADGFYQTTLVEVMHGHPRGGDHPRGARARGVDWRAVELGISVAIVEMALGVFAGNVLGITSTPWIDFVAAFAGILLTFLAGAEVDPGLFRQRFRESVVIGGLSFALPFAAAGLFAYSIAGWDLRQSEIAGIALSTTSLAVVYAVLVETGVTNTEIGR